MTVRQPAFWAVRTASMVSVRLPIWLGLIRMAHVGGLARDGLFQDLGIGNQQVVGDDLQLAAKPLG